MRERYECGTCGVVTEVREHLCDPKQLSGKYDYCGTTPESTGMCDTMKKGLSYECSTCGRPVESAHLACRPVRTR